MRRNMQIVSHKKKHGGDNRAVRYNSSNLTTVRYISTNRNYILTQGMKDDGQRESIDWAIKEAKERDICGQHAKAMVTDLSGQAGRWGS